MRQTFKNREEPSWLNFDPRVRTVALRLWDAGFLPMEPEDAEDESDDFDEPHVLLECSPENLVAEAHRLHELVTSWRIPETERVCAGCGGDTCGMEAVYDPVSREACLVLWGVDDKMLSADLVGRRAAGQPPSRELRS